MKTTLLTSLLLVLALPAHADLKSLRQDIARAEKDQPGSFLALAAQRNAMPDLDQKRRGPYAVVGPQLKTLGPSVFLPLLDEAIKGIPAGPDWTATARKGWAVGVLEALGAIGDARAQEPVEALLARETDPEVVRACAAALAKLSCDAALSVLAPLAEKSGPKQIPALSGLGECRQLQAVQVLARVLAARPDVNVAKAAAKGLSTLANSWAWQTELLASRSDRTAIRVAAATALVNAFVALRGDAREATETALVIVDAPEAAGLIEKARGQSPSEAAELTRLAARLANSPMRDRVK